MNVLDPTTLGAGPQQPPIVVAVASDADPLCRVRAALIRDRAVAVVDALRQAARECGAMRVVLVTDGQTDAQPLQRQWSAASAVDDAELAVRSLASSLMVSEPTALVNLLRGSAPIARALRPGTGDILGNAPIVVRDVAALVEALDADGIVTVDVTGAVAQPGVIRLSGTASLTDLVAACGGMRAGSALSFALVGGATGALVPADQAADPLPWNGSGTRSVVVADESFCVVDTALRQLEVVVRDACGLCVVCREGSFQAASILADATTGRSRPDHAGQLDQMGAAMGAGSLCGVGRGAGALISSLVRGFGGELDAHRRKRCPAGACTAYLTFHVLPALCTGCADCLDVCLDDAIAGRRGFVHVIDQEDCTKCGACLTACQEKAVVTAGPIKPRTPARPVRVAR